MSSEDRKLPVNRSNETLFWPFFCFLCLGSVILSITHALCFILGAVIFQLVYPEISDPTICSKHAPTKLTVTDRTTVRPCIPPLD